MVKFKDLGVRSNAIVGKGIEIDELFDRRILIEKTKIEPTNFPGKNKSGLRMQMQVCLATFKDPKDLKDDEPEYVVDQEGKPVGQRRSCFTGSDILIGYVQDAIKNLPNINLKRQEEGKPVLKSIYPLDTTIVKIGKCFQFT